MRQKPAIKAGVMQDSTPPVRIRSQRPWRMMSKAYPIASVDDVHPVDTT